MGSLCMHANSVVWAVLLLLNLVVSKKPFAGTSAKDIVLDRRHFENKYVEPSWQDLSHVREPRGILFPSGGIQRLANTYLAVRVLRDHLHCELPIEVAHFGEEEMDPYHRSLFQVIATAI